MEKLMNLKGLMEERGGGGKLLPSCTRDVFQV